MSAKVNALGLAQAALQRNVSVTAPSAVVESETVSGSDVVLPRPAAAAASTAKPAMQVVPPPGLSQAGEAAVSFINEALRTPITSDETLGRFSRAVLDSKNHTELVLSVYVARVGSQRTIWSTPARQQVVRNLTMALGRVGQAAPAVSRPHTDLLGFPQRDLTFVDVAHKVATSNGAVGELVRVAQSIESVDGLRAAFDATCRLLGMGRMPHADQKKLFIALYSCQAKLVAKLGSNATVIPLAASGLKGFVLGQAPRPMSFSGTDIDLVSKAIQKTELDQIGTAKAFTLAMARSFLFDTKDLALFTDSLEERQRNNGKAPEYMRRMPTPIDEL